METFFIVVLAIVLVAVAYVLSSGIAFALMYRMGPRFPSQLASSFYQPLESLSQRSSLFSQLYNGLHRQCYRLLVGELVNNWVPPPPSIPGTGDSPKNGQ
jgi:hypothetical protein